MIFTSLPDSAIFDVNGLYEDINLGEEGSLIICKKSTALLFDASKAILIPDSEARNEQHIKCYSLNEGK